MIVGLIFQILKKKIKIFFPKISECIKKLKIELNYFFSKNYFLKYLIINLKKNLISII